MRTSPAISVCLLLTLLSACDGNSTPELSVSGESKPSASDGEQFGGLPADEPALDWKGEQDPALEQELAEAFAEVEATPGDAAARQRLAMLLKRMNRRQESLEQLLEAVSLEPDDQRLLMDLALAHTAVAQLAEAQAIYARLADSPRLRAVVLHNMGNIALRLQQLDQAIEYYRQALEARPNYLLATYHLGLALQEAGLTKQSYETFEQVMRLDPSTDRTQKSAQFDALHRMGSLSLTMGKPDRAVQLLVRLLEFYPGHPNANFSYGRALTLLGREEEARRAFDKHMQVPRRTEGRIGFIGSTSGGTVIEADRLKFDDATATAGLRYTNVCGASDPSAKGWATEALGAGAAWLDYDGDGNLDLYLVNGSAHDRGPLKGEPNQLFRGDGRGGFVDVTRQAGVGHRGWGYGAAVGDIDNDGDPDLYVTNYGPNVLFRNNGDGTFADVTAAAGVGDRHWGVSSAFFDMEGDGDLDLYVGNYLVSGPGKVPRRGETPFCAWKGIDVSCGPKGLIPVQDVLYRNDGDGTFTDATRESGVWLETPRYTLAVVTADYDDDGDQDIYLANDSVQNSLWRNDGDGSFTDIGVVTMTAFNADGHGQSGMGADFGDYDGDGWLDLAVTNFSHDLNTLYRSVEGRYFIDDSALAGLVATNMALSWGIGFYDFDLDSDLDLMIANGHIFPEVDDYDVGTRYRQSNHLFVNRGAGRLAESSASAGPGLQVQRSFRSAAFADYDNDGDIDVLFTALDDEVLLLSNESSTSGHFLQIRLVGTRSNRDGVGARVTLSAGGRNQVRQRKGGGSFLAANDSRLHFGLGREKTVERIEVRWPSGTIDVLLDVAADRVLEIVEGQWVEPGQLIE